MYFETIIPLSADPQVNQKMQIIKKVAGIRGIRANLPENLKSPARFDLSELVERFKNAIFILADLSYERPSCYYELGLAEALEARVFLIAQQGTDIHQTSNRDMVRFYDDLEEYESLVNQIFEEMQDELPLISSNKA